MDEGAPNGIERLELADLAVHRWPELLRALARAAAATSIHLFRERGSGAFPTDAGSLRRLRGELKHLPIDVTLETDGMSPGCVRVRLRSQGVGELSASGPIVAAMPSWMRPTIDRGDDDASREVTVVVDLGRPGHWPSPDAHRRLAADPVLGTSPGTTLRAATDLLHALAAYAMVPLRIDGSLTPSALDEKCTIFDPESGVELAWIHDDGPAGSDWTHDRHSAYLSDRGTPFGKWGRYRRPLRMHIGLHDAERPLRTWASDKSWEEERAEMDRRIDAALMRTLPRWIDEHDEAAVPPAQRCWVSRALLHLGPRGAPRTTVLAMDPRQLWRAAVIDEAGTTLGQIADEPYVDWVIPPIGGGGIQAVLPTLERRIPVRAMVANFDVHLFHRHCRELAAEPDRQRAVGVVRWGEGRAGATSEAFRARLRALGMQREARPLAAAPDDFSGLAVDLDHVRAAFPDDDRHLASRIAVYQHVLVLPYLVREGTIDVPEIAAWVEWVAARRLGGPVTPASLAGLTLHFLETFDGDVRAGPGVRIVYDLEALRAQLVAAFGALTTPGAA